MAGEKETVGIIGVGRMGLPMLRHLRTQGHEVWARDLDDKQLAEARNAGAKIAATPAEIGKHATFVIAITVTDAQVNEVLTGKDGLIETVRPGTIAFPAYTLDAVIPMGDVCPNSVWEWSGSGLRQVPVPQGSDTFQLAAAGGNLDVAASAGCAARITPPSLTRLTPDLSPTVLAPAPDPLAVATQTTVSWLIAR